MLYQGEELKEGNKYMLSSIGKIITLQRIKTLDNGKTAISYTFLDEQDQLQKKEIYLNVLEMMGMERINKI